MNEYFKINTVVFLILLFQYSCNNVPLSKNETTTVQHNCMNAPSRFAPDTTFKSIKFNGDTSTTGMIFIPDGTFDMGGDNDQASEDELPKHKVHLSGFYMDITEVTNAQV